MNSFPSIFVSAIVAQTLASGAALARERQGAGFAVGSVASIGADGPGGR
jgi:hypothetical protein